MHSRGSKRFERDFILVIEMMVLTAPFKRNGAWGQVRDREILGIRVTRHGSRRNSSYFGA